MAARDRADPAKTRQAVLAIADWLRDDTRPAPDRDALATAVRLTARTLAAVAPGPASRSESHRLSRCSASPGRGTPAAHHPMSWRPIRGRGCCWPPDC